MMKVHKWNIVYISTNVYVDYVLGPYNVVFTPRDKRVPLIVPLLDDNVFEGNETFTLIILPSESISIGTSRAIVTIVDDDGE